MATTEPNALQTTLLTLAARGAHHWNEWVRCQGLTQIDLSALNLRGADFDQLCFEGCIFPADTSFDDTLLPDHVSFAGAQFSHLCSFRRTQFGANTSFAKAYFAGEIDFDNAIFGDKADFRQARFDESARLSNTTFGDVAIFLGATFAKEASFKSAVFGDRADFTGSLWSGRAILSGARFGARIEFSAAIFYGATQFSAASFGDQAAFEGATFHDDASFESASFLGLSSFHHARFLGFANFSSVSFAGQASFTYVLFRTPPSLRGASDVDYLDLHEIEVRLGTDQNRILCAIFGEWNDNEKIIPRLRTLRGIADTTNFVDAERELFLLERQMELGCGWVRWRRALRDWQVTYRQSLNKRVSGYITLAIQQLALLVRMTSDTLIMLLYRWSSNCGRSALWPAFWLMVSTPVFHALYRSQYASLKGVDVNSLDTGTIKLLDDFALGSLVPLAATTRPSYQGAIELLFSSDGFASVPGSFQYTSLAQGVLDLMLIFLIGVALRNHFLVR